MLALAAEVDKCTEKFKTCKTSCENLWFQCKARNDIEYCNARRKQCNAECDADLKKCQGTAKPSPNKPSPKK